MNYWTGVVIEKKLNGRSQKMHLELLEAIKGI